MRKLPPLVFPSLAIIAAALAVMGGAAVAAQDKYSVKVPNGLGFSDFRGYESWQTISVSQSGELIEVILGNPAMIAAYGAGIPAGGRHFPDGVKMAKIHWKAKKSADAPSPTTVPGDLDDVDFMVRDGAKYAATGGWGYAQFNYDPKKDEFTPLGTGTDCGYSCHTIAKAKDYVFTAYGKR